MQHNRDLYYLEQMVYHAEEALEFFSQIDNSEERLFNDSLYQKGISKSLEQMGEMLAVGRISEELQERYNYIPWRAIKGYRNMGVHEYDRIDWSEVSALLKSELRGNIADLQMIIRKERMKNKQL
ncbi:MULTISPECIES: DUF86 domain-containing protein [Lactococcus]|uniref:HepT-like ribonuclease domain-containing protein n=1 Tax=Lactococcus TaxID=1357 RepID=UPI00030833BA|nr:HepT-like ribonuclease domain-containing protein [Lactococcus garvieae]